jgi:hypothetical protein
MNAAAEQRLGTIIQRVVDRLLAEGLLALAPAGDASQLVGDVLGHMNHASDFAQAGRVIGEGLLASGHVDELYASNGDILEIMNHLDG